LTDDCRWSERGYAEKNITKKEYRIHHHHQVASLRTDELLDGAPVNEPELRTKMHKIRPQQGASLRLMTLSTNCLMKYLPNELESCNRPSVVTSKPG